MDTNNLKELRELRIQEKAIKARIDSISDAATQEALTLAPEGGEFNIPGIGTFQLQCTETFDLSNSHRYKGENAKLWRDLAKQKAEAQKLAAACTKQMATILKNFKSDHPDKEPDEIKLTVKVID